MAFNEVQKLSTKRKAHFRCCLCHTVGVEVHHIVPQAEDGPDDEDNAAPLCPSCHETYGANPTKRKFIREARELWYEICATRYASDTSRIDDLQKIMSEAATKQDLNAAISQIAAIVKTADPVHQDDRRPEPNIPKELLQSPIAPHSLTTYLRIMYSIVRHCGPSEIHKLSVDLAQVGYTDVASLHSMMNGTSEAFSDVARLKRDEGEDMDRWTDSFPIRLFLPIFDEKYCRIHFPNIYNKKIVPIWRRPERKAGLIDEAD